LVQPSECMPACLPGPAIGCRSACPACTWFLAQDSAPLAASRASTSLASPPPPYAPPPAHPPLPLPTARVPSAGYTHSHFTTDLPIAPIKGVFTFNTRHFIQGDAAKNSNVTGVFISVDPNFHSTGVLDFRGKVCAWPGRRVVLGGRRWA
jgi:hypothetical protein